MERAHVVEVETDDTCRSIAVASYGTA